MSRELLTISGLLILFGGVAHGWAPGGRFALYWADLAWTLAAFFTGIRCLLTAKCSHGRYRLSWILIALACFSWFFGMLAWDWFELAVGWTTPFPSWSDIGFSAFAPLMAYGLYHRRPAAFASTAFRLLQIGKIGILGICLLLIHLLAFAQPLTDPATTTFYKGMALGYPVLYISALLFSISLFWRWQKPQTDSVTGLLTIGLAIHTVTNSLYAYELLGQTFQGGSFIDIFWLIGFASLYLAASHPSAPQETEHTDHSCREEDGRALITMDFIFPMAGLALLGTVVFLTRKSISLLPHDILFPLFFLLVGFVGLREWASHRFERDLAKQRLTFEEKYRTLFNASNDGLLILEPHEGAILEANPRSMELFDRPIPPQGLLRFSSLAQEGSLVAGKSLDEWRQDAFLSGSEAFEWQARDGDEAAIWISVQLLRVEFVEQDLLVAILREITAAKKIEALKEKSRRQYEELTARIPVGVYTYRMTPDGSSAFDYVSLRFCAMLDLKQQALLQEAALVISVIHPKERRAFVRLSRKASKNLEPFIWEGRFVIRGQDRWFRVESVPSPATSGDRLWNGVMIDVTDRREAEEAMRQAQWDAEKANRVKSEFLAVMSHEIRTPMNAILGMADVLAETNLDQEQRQYLDIQMRAGRNLLALIGDILDLSQIEAGRLPIEVRPYNLEELIREALEIQALRARQKGLQLRFSLFPPIDPEQQGDPQRVRQVLLNLIGNAIKFTEDGEITVSVSRQEPDRLLFSVADTGIGIPEVYHDAIFEPFLQVDSSLTRKKGGSGLGLAICRRLILAMGGRIWVENRESRGTVFHFTLPALPSPSPLPEDLSPKGGPGDGATKESDPPFPKESPLSLLLVEDSEENQEVIKAYLKGQNVSLDCVFNGAEGVESFKSRRYDLVLMDIQMPVMDGYEATRHMRAWETTTGAHRTPIVALTAHVFASDEEKILSAGCDYRLTKPVRKKHLLEAVTGASPSSG